MELIDRQQELQRLEIGLCSDPPPPGLSRFEIDVDAPEDPETCWRELGKSSVACLESTLSVGRILRIGRGSSLPGSYGPARRNHRLEYSRPPNGRMIGLGRSVASSTGFVRR